ncbi:alkaline shock response membrane anchor protein AmaP [Leuconostoc pseudomesenteroides]|uniref:alkaline shock response membrane anchor protein AmaP n=1 Tax=Leuconostoc pseudomesenteroides TaxID=33968 RepID=UPI0021538678|nr:alkaline shock response membrane anchor protein AmaP [Leuconostoc pseudomesenteroides]
MASGESKAEREINTRKTIKIFLILIIFTYVVGICLLIWPEVLESLFWSLKRLGINFSGNTDMIRYYYGVVLLSLSVIALLIVLLIPNQLPDILLERTKTGRLALSNYGVKQFIRTQLSGEGLSNIQVKLKNTRRQKKSILSLTRLIRGQLSRNCPVFPIS